MQDSHNTALIINPSLVVIGVPQYPVKPVPFWLGIFLMQMLFASFVA
jgi:hypothetical protein